MLRARVAPVRLAWLAVPLTGCMCAGFPPYPADGGFVPTQPEPDSGEVVVADAGSQGDGGLFQAPVTEVVTPRWDGGTTALELTGVTIGRTLDVPNCSPYESLGVPFGVVLDRASVVDVSLKPGWAGYVSIRPGSGAPLLHCLEADARVVLPAGPYIFGVGGGFGPFTLRLTFSEPTDGG